MRVFLSIFLFTQTLLPFATSNLLPSDLDSVAPRDADHWYIVTPTDPWDKSQVAATEDYLRSLAKDRKVFSESADGGTRSWKVSLDDDAIANTLNQHPGIEGALPSGTARRNPQQLQQREDYKDYIVFAEEGADVKEIREFLGSKVSDKNRVISHVKASRHYKGDIWGSVTLTESALNDVKGHAGIKTVESQPPVHHNRVLPKLRKREDLTWKKASASKDLIMLSQPKDLKLDDLKNFVREGREGAGSYIYVLDQGVQKYVINEKKMREFPENRYSVWQTAANEEVRLGPDHQPYRPGENTDDSKNKDGVLDSHGTGVASKAAGELWGVAKKAHIISIKHEPDVVDQLSGAFQEVENDWALNPDRIETSVIISTSSDAVKYDDKENPEFDRLIKNWLKDFADLGVPVVYASGNSASDDFKDRGDIDEFPMVIKDSENQLINVGAANYDGTRVKGSQGGSKLSVYAPGFDVRSQSRYDEVTDDHFGGTSAAAPFVAGLIATYFAYSPRPWVVPGQPEQTGVERVKAIAEYLQSDRSSYPRADGSDVNIVWNGATKTDHDNATPDEGQSCSTTKRDTCQKANPICTGLGTNKYISRDTLDWLIWHEYCPKWDGAQGEIGAGSYLHNTPEYVEISITGDTSAQGLPTKDSCINNLRRVLDECDGDGNQNPMNYKGGGNLTIDHWTYSLRPISDRPSLLKKPTGTCKLDQCTPNGCRVWMWGAGWLDSDLGLKLRDAFAKAQADITSDPSKAQGRSGYHLDKWDKEFKYELLDGREWIVTIGADFGVTQNFPLRSNARTLVPQVMKSAANGNLDIGDCEGGDIHLKD